MPSDITLTSLEASPFNNISYSSNLNNMNSIARALSYNLIVAIYVANLIIHVQWI